MYALSSAQMRALEDRCAEAGIRGFTLMENAGRAAALAINGTIPVKGKKCVVFCGSGNNGWLHCGSGAQEARGGGAGDPLL